MEEAIMKSASIPSNRLIPAGALVTAFLALIYVLINLFVIGGNDFVYSLNNNVTIPLAIVTTLFAFSLWNLVNIGRINRLLWGGLLAGWTLWMIAEILWVVYGYLYQEVPYPSPADAFWLLGYIPMAYGLYIRSRELPSKPNRLQRITIWAVSVVTVAITVVAILVPIIQTNDPSNLLESILNVLYPLADLVLLIIVLRLIFVYGAGEFGLGWNLLTAGFILHSISNLVFSRASLVDLYYPGLKVNFISSVGVDVPYNLSYLVWFVGLYRLRQSLVRHKPFGSIPQPRLVPNTSILIFLKNDDTVLEASENISLLSGDNPKKGNTLAEVLNVHPDQAQVMIDILKNEKKITDHLVLVEGRPGVSEEAYLTGLMTVSPDGDCTGYNLVLRILVEGDYTLDRILTKEQAFMVSHLRRTCGSKERDQIRTLLLDYHLAYLKQLYNIAYRTGGGQLSQALLDRLQEIDREHQWGLQFDTENLINPGDYQLNLLRTALPALVEEARRFVSQLSDPKTVELEIQNISSQFQAAVHRNVEYFQWH
jgi:hypothetical protein